MANTENVQTTFLEEVKKRLPPNLSFVDELAEALNISRDSAYRRIRGETILSLDEVRTLVHSYNVSLDTILTLNAEIISFHHQFINHSTFTFNHWLKSILDKLEMITQFTEPNKELIYYAKDLPIFYYFQFPELGAFKMFFWMKSVMGYPEYEHQKFSPTVVPRDFLETGSKIWQRYASLPSTELWSDETPNVTLKQIEYFWDCGYFQKPEEAYAILDQFSDLLTRIRQWTVTGTKDGKGALQFYKNEILSAENTILFKMGEKRVVFLTHNIADIMTTSDEEFCRRNEDFIKALLKKATLISGTGEKERSRFFNQILEKVQAVRSRIH